MAADILQEDQRSISLELSDINNSEHLLAANCSYKSLSDVVSITKHTRYYACIYVVDFSESIE